MNIWKASTLGLAAALTIVVGKGAVNKADASPAGADRPTAIAGFEWGSEQPHMEKALEDLRGARHSLEIAAEHKHGWRAAALAHTDAAIKDTIDGIEYARNHPHDN
jgi:hypothetical protein